MVLIIIFDEEFSNVKLSEVVLRDKRILVCGISVNLEGQRNNLAIFFVLLYVNHAIQFVFCAEKRNEECFEAFVFPVFLGRLQDNSSACVDKFNCIFFINLSHFVKIVQSQLGEVEANQILGFLGVFYFLRA